jgi:hypothetical protein
MHAESGAASPEDFLKQIAVNGAYVGGQVILHAASRSTAETATMPSSSSLILPF